MKDKIGRIANGNIEYELPRILLSEERLNISVEAGKRWSGQVVIGNSAGKAMKGLVCADSRLVEVMTPQFVGVANTISLVVHAELLADKTELDGEITFVTDCGEEKLPYRIRVTAPSLASSEGLVVNMKQFAILARRQWSEAVRLFTEPEFRQFLHFHEPESEFLYEVMTKSASPDGALEEFLVATGKKTGVYVQSDRDMLEYEVGASAFSDRITLVKSNFGYLHLIISSTAPFLTLEHNDVTMDQFRSNAFDLRYVVMPEQMGYGNNYGSIVIEGGNQRLEIPVTCRKPHPMPQEREQRKRRKQLIARMYENFLEYQMNKLPVGRYVAEAEGLLAKSDAYSPADSIEKKLYRIHLCRLAGKESPANAMLRSITEEGWRTASVECKAAYLFLKAERVAGNKAEMMEQLYIMCNEGQRKTLPALLLLRLDERYGKNRRLRFDELRGIYDNGNHSPLLYLEAARVLNEEPTLLHEAGDFEVQTLSFALKHEYLEREVAVQYSYLAERFREFRSIHYKVLTDIYRQFRLTETLSAICQLLIRNHMKDSRYAEWYERGVEEQLRIPELYEYYMYTKTPDVDEALDPNIYTYFSYNSKLNDKKLSYLYANIVSHKKSNPTVYDNYREKIHEYALAQMRNKKNDDLLAILYNDCLTHETTKQEAVSLLPEVAFRHEIRCQEPGILYVCVSHRELQDEVIVPLIGGVAQVDIFSEDAVISLLDGKQNRFLSGISYEDRKLMHVEGMFREAAVHNTDNSMLLLYLAGKAQKEKRYEEETINWRKQACRLPGLREEFREALIRTLVLYYYDNLQEERLEEFIRELNFGGIPDKQRGKMIGLLILRGQYNRALELLADYGYEEVELRLLEKLCVNVAKEYEKDGEARLTNLMQYVFRQGRRHERIVAYLINHYRGTTEDMYRLWKEATAQQLETKELDERLLAQILFTESYLPYAEQALKRLDRPGGNPRLVRAFTTYVAYKYLVSDVAMGEITVATMRKHVYHEENDVCVLALLKLYSGMDELSKEDQDFAEYWLTRMESRGKVLPAFLRFAKYFKLPESLEDKHLIEYRTNPQHRVTLRYSYRKAGKRQIKEVPMRDICYGIFVKELILFVGESTEYVICEESGTETLTTEKTVLQGGSQTVGESKSRFAQINAIITARKNEEKDKAMELLNQYIKNEFAITQLFHAKWPEE